MQKFRNSQCSSWCWAPRRQRLLLRLQKTTHHQKPGPIDAISDPDAPNYRHRCNFRASCVSACTATSATWRTGAPSALWVAGVCRGIMWLLWGSKSCSALDVSWSRKGWRWGTYLVSLGWGPTCASTTKPHSAQDTGAYIAVVRASLWSPFSRTCRVLKCLRLAKL